MTPTVLASGKATERNRLGEPTTEGRLSGQWGRERQAGPYGTSSVTAYRGSPHLLLDYAATKGAIVAFTRSLSQGLAAAASA